jgi:nucleoside-specific outer membrane channel protein Tsx
MTTAVQHSSTWSQQNTRPARQGKLGWPGLLLLLVTCVILSSAEIHAQEAEAATDMQAGTVPLPSESGAQAKSPHFFSENTVSFIYGPQYRTHFIITPSGAEGADIARSTLQFKHLDSWKYGSNLFTFDIRKSSSVEPAAGGGTGALELYAVLRSDFSLNRITNTRTFSAGPLRDVSFEVGANLETKNSHYAPEERTLYVGPKLQFKLPRGFFNVGLHLRKEWNHQGILGRDESYATNFNIEPTWSIPFRVRRVAMAFEGFADFNTPKGKDSFGKESASEFLIRPQLKFDLSAILHTESRFLEAGIGLEYWHNVYGKPAAYVPGAEQLTPLFTLTVHLPR